MKNTCNPWQQNPPIPARAMKARERQVKAEEAKMERATILKTYHVEVVEVIRRTVTVKTDDSSEESIRALLEVGSYTVTETDHDHFEEIVSIEED